MFETNHTELGEQPIPGDVVTFTYENYSTAAVPVNPELYRIRRDMTWEDVIRNYATSDRQHAVLSGMMHSSKVKE